MSRTEDVMDRSVRETQDMQERRLIKTPVIDNGMCWLIFLCWILRSKVWEAKVNCCIWVSSVLERIALNYVGNLGHCGWCVLMLSFSRYLKIYQKPLPLHNPRKREEFQKPNTLPSSWLVCVCLCLCICVSERENLFPYSENFHFQTVFCILHKAQAQRDRIHCSVLAGRLLIKTPKGRNDGTRARFNNTRYCCYMAVAERWRAVGSDVFTISGFQEEKVKNYADILVGGHVQKNMQLLLSALIAHKRTFHMVNPSNLCGP